MCVCCMTIRPESSHHFTKSKIGHPAGSQTAAIERHPDWVSLGPPARLSRSGDHSKEELMTSMIDQNLAVLIGPSPVENGLPQPPVFSSVEAERKYRKEQLAAGFRIFGRFGFSEGVTGHITVRDPEHPEYFWVNPFGMSFNRIKASDLILVDHNGDVIEGTRAVNRAAFVIHSRVHEARPDALSAAHSHS